MLIACTKPVKEIDETDYWTFSVMNSVEEEVTVECSINNSIYVINIPAGQCYTYQQDLMSGHIASDKIPVFMSEHIKFSLASGRTFESGSEEHFQQMWNETEDHHLCIVISNELFSNNAHSKLLK